MQHVQHLPALAELEEAAQVERAEEVDLARLLPLEVGWPSCEPASPATPPYGLAEASVRLTKSPIPWLPVVPWLPRSPSDATRASPVANGSSLTVQPSETAGKTPSRFSVPKRDDPSARTLAERRAAWRW